MNSREEAAREAERPMRMREPAMCCSRSHGKSLAGEGQSDQHMQAKTAQIGKHRVTGGGDHRITFSKLES